MIRAAIALLVIILAGCSSQPVEPKYYLLRSDSDLSTRPLQPVDDFALGQVIIAPYIDQRGLLMETTDGDFRPARHHLWAEPLYQGARLFLLKEISSKIGKDLLPSPRSPNTATVDVRIDQMHGTVNGNARLVAYWWLERDGELLGAYQFAEELPLAADGYGALAAAEKELLSILAGQMAESIASAGTPGD